MGIPIKEKPCKGINRALGFESCGLPSLKRTFGLCDSCLYDFYTTTEIGKVLFSKRKIEVAKSNWKEQKKVLKENVKTLSDYKNDLQKEINTIVRLIDRGHPCIATGSFEGKMNAGHYIGVQANPTTRYHLENIWLQSEHSNMWKSGDTLRYQDGIISLFGKEYLDRLNSFKTIPVIKLSVDEIKEKIIICREIVKELKSHNHIYSNANRMEKRKEFNSRIGIYK